MNAAPPRRFLRLPQVLDRTGLSRTRQFVLETRGEFPRRIKISTKAAAWLESEVEAWIDQKIAASRAPVSKVAPVTPTAVMAAPASPAVEPAPIKRPRGRPRKSIATPSPGAAA